MFEENKKKTERYAIKDALSDDEMYSRGGYNTVVGIPFGSECTIELPAMIYEPGQIKTNGILEGCRGGCDGSKWFMGYDEGFLTLAGVKGNKAHNGCGFVNSLSVLSEKDVDNFNHQGKNFAPRLPHACSCSCKLGLVGVLHIDNYTRDSFSVIDNPNDDERAYIACYAAGCAYAYGAGQVKQRQEQDAGNTTRVRRGGVVWEDRRLWSSFLIVDAGVVQVALVGGGCTDDLGNCGVTRVINDVIDLGYDWSSGDVCNSILTLSKGKTTRIELARAYAKVASVLNRMSLYRNDTVGAVGVVTTHAWQMCNTRHRVIACSLISDDPGIGPTNTIASWNEVVVLDKDPSTPVNLEFEEGGNFTKVAGGNIKALQSRFVREITIINCENCIPGYSNVTAEA
jgi:hypothetical protein